MNTPIPCPKKYFLTGQTLSVLPQILVTDPVFESAASVFSGYAKNAFGVEFARGDSGIILQKSDDVEYEYHISITDKVIVSAGDSAGMNHALATLMQLFDRSGEDLRLPCGQAADFSGSSWRGLMLDLSRCWHEADFLFRAADLCWLYKMNRLQLHLTDDQGIRFPFKAFPKMVHEDHYTEEQLTSLVEYCQARDIIIVPEIDAPGHAKPFTLGHPEAFGSIRGLMSAEETTFASLKTVYEEVAAMFPNSPWIHVGGDEAAIAKWDTCEGTKAYCKEHNIADVHQLYGHYVLRLAEIIKEIGRKPAVWEGFSKECNDMLPKDLLVFAWESYYQYPTDLVKGGFPVVNASWKPLYIDYPEKMWSVEKILDWEKYVWENHCEASPATKAPMCVPPDSNVLGGQLYTWGDYMQPSLAYAAWDVMIANEYDAVRERLPAVSEKLWNPGSKPDKAAFRWNLAMVDKLFLSMCETK